MSFNWNCPYCDRAQTVTSYNEDTVKISFETTRTNMGLLGVKAQLIVCSNPDCNKATITANIIEADKYNGGTFIPSPYNTYSTHCLVPQSSARPQPEYIPAALREDYTEACLISDLSPKASATLSRRCLQGMIRDFCGITNKSNLYQEIIELKKLVDSDKAPKGVSDDSIDALDAVRKIGNIGAHMEKDINIIVDVDPSEAQVLIELIESLFEEWYVARENRKNRFAKITQMAGDKDALKLPAKEVASKD